MGSPDELLAFLQSHVNVLATESDIAKIMRPLASDSAWAYLGGSGARQQIFRLPGDLRAVFQFDGYDRLVAYGAYRTAAPWREVKAGESADPVSSPEVSLILVDPSRER